MAKKRKHSTAPATNGPREIKASEGLKVINDYLDVADSEDEFHAQRDKVAFEDGPEAKRRRKIEEEDAFLEESEEEVLGYGKGASSDDDDGDDDVEEEEEEEVNGVEDEEEIGDWGASRKDYYEADVITTENDAQMEEAEAKRLQQKQLSKMKDADFGFDESEWAAPTDEIEGQGDRVEEVLQDLQISPEMGTSERMKLLQSRYPEFEFLADDFVRLQPLLKLLHQDIKSAGDGDRVKVAKCRALTAYVASLSMYFAILTSTTQDDEDDADNEKKAALALDPTELKDHAVMETLLKCRELWASVKDLKSTTQQEILLQSESDVLTTMPIPTPQPTSQKLSKKARKQLAQEAAIATAAETRRSRLEAIDSSLSNLDSLLPTSTSTKRSKPATTTTTTQSPVDSDSDFGEETHLSTRALAEKASKKKSLRFYTSQIAQTSNRRADAGRDAGGDNDLPVKERLRDKQARLNAEAEKRGRALDKYGRGTALGDEGEEAEGSGNEVTEATKALAVRDEEDEYYDMIAHKTNKQKADKAEFTAAKAQADAEGAIVRIIEEVGAVGEKRAIGYKIEKNKGLAPKRSKDVRNPRVKKRKKYEEKMKKLSSMRATYKGGEERGGYGGEKTGIKSNLVKSIKL